jgi:hypothetical protein
MVRSVFALCSRSWGSVDGQERTHRRNESALSHGFARVDVWQPVVPSRAWVCQDRAAVGLRQGHHQVHVENTAAVHGAIAAVATL